MVVVFIGTARNKRRPNRRHGLAELECTLGHLRCAGCTFNSASGLVPTHV